MKARWTVQRHRGGTWTEVAQGKSRIRATVVFLIAATARPTTSLRLLWNQDSVPPNLHWYGLVTDSELPT